MYNILVQNHRQCAHSECLSLSLSLFTALLFLFLFLSLSLFVSLSFCFSFSLSLFLFVSLSDLSLSGHKALFCANFCQTRRAKERPAWRPREGGEEDQVFIR